MARFSCLSVYLLFRCARRAVRIITNPMKRNLRATLRALAAAEKYPPPVEKCRTKSLYLLLFLVGKFRSENCDPSSYAHEERLFLPSHFPYPSCCVPSIRDIEHAIHFPLTLSRSFKQVYKSRKLYT